MSDVINVPRILEPTASHGKLARASAIFDEDIGKFQSELNSISIKGTLKLVHLTEGATAAEEPKENTQIDVIYVNDTGRPLTVGVNNEVYRTPNGQLMVIVVPSGGYAEVNFLNIGGTIFVRGL
jgi:hypothetical protein